MTQSLSAWTVSVGVSAVDLGVPVAAVAVGDFVSHGMWPHSTNFPFQNMQLMKNWQKMHKICVNAAENTLQLTLISVKYIALKKIL